MDSDTRVNTAGGSPSYRRPGDGSLPGARNESGFEGERQGAGTEAARTLPTRVFREGDWIAHRYRIERFVGHGSMGEVYAAMDFELRERVALKTLRTDRAHDETTLERFRREVVYMRRVTHPSVGRLFDVGHAQVGGASGDERSVLFFTMELIDGESLASLLAREGPFDGRFIRSVAEEILSALEAAHAVGIVHRDVKASNVLLQRRSGDELRAVVMDFGFARALEHPQGSTLSADGAILGTPAYMAPEQLTGQDVTPATDIYAVGVLLFEMATGTHPFVGSTVAETAMMRLAVDAPRARERRADIDPVLDGVIARCLARDPQQRFSCAADVRDALRATAPPTLPPSKAPSRLPAVARRWSMGRWGVVAVILGGLATGLALHSWPPVRSPPAAPRPATAPLASTETAIPEASTVVRRRRPMVVVLDLANITGQSNLDFLSGSVGVTTRFELSHFRFGLPSGTWRPPSSEWRRAIRIRSVIDIRRNEVA